VLAVNDSVSWHDIIPRKRPLLSGKRHPAHGVMVRCYGCYAYGFQFSSHLADFLFFFTIFRLRLGVTFRGLYCLLG